MRMVTRYHWILLVITLRTVHVLYPALLQLKLRFLSDTPTLNMLSKTVTLSNSVESSVVAKTGVCSFLRHKASIFNTF